MVMSNYKPNKNKRRSTMSDEKEVKQESSARIINLINPACEVDAVLFDDNEHIYREPVICLALYSDGDMEFLTADVNGQIICPEYEDCFLGYEFRRVQKDWSGELSDKVAINKEIDTTEKSIV